MNLRKDINHKRVKKIFQKKKWKIYNEFLYRFIDNYSKIKDSQSSLFESFIKLTKNLTGYSSSNLFKNIKNR